MQHSESLPWVSSMGSKPLTGFQSCTDSTLHFLVAHIFIPYPIAIIPFFALDCTRDVCNVYDDGCFSGRCMSSNLIDVISSPVCVTGTNLTKSEVLYLLTTTFITVAGIRLSFKYSP
ncbi:hypothetical protein BXZ70DRAFT_470850 [Cristinia sonorae]|uniref:Uncharacterized protein n=1 Tax=Cristinia sonorae TaxID=1940300 RepID=A0A8K0UIQ2_9AGAR|nr:hypothetical protein BXZ70DRAFT_470850 [Cristinia sonorae]